MTAFVIRKKKKREREKSFSIKLHEASYKFEGKCNILQSLQNSKRKKIYSPNLCQKYRSYKHWTQCTTHSSLRYMFNYNLLDQMIKFSNKKYKIKIWVKIVDKSSRRVALLWKQSGRTQSSSIEISPKYPALFGGFFDHWPRNLPTMCFVLLKLSDEEHQNAKVTLKTKEPLLICIQTHKRESLQRQPVKDCTQNWKHKNRFSAFSILFRGGVYLPKAFPNANLRKPLSALWTTTKNQEGH